jgi:hypothetical protein
MNEWCLEGWWNETDGKNRKCSKEKPVPLPVCPTQIAHGPPLGEAVDSSPEPSSHGHMASDWKGSREVPSEIHITQSGGVHSASLKIH